MYDPREWNLSDGDLKLHVDQRLRDGVSDVDVWNLDHYLLQVLSTGLHSLGNNSHGCPQSYVDRHNGDVNLAFEEWTADLHKAAGMFEDIIKQQESNTETIDQDKVNEAFGFVAKNLVHLWD